MSGALSMKQLHHSSEIGNRLKEIRFDRLAFCESTPAGVVLAKPATLIVSPVYFHCPQPPPLALLMHLEEKYSTHSAFRTAFLVSSTSVKCVDKEKLLGQLTLIVLFVIQCSIILGPIQNRKWHLHDD